MRSAALAFALAACAALPARAADLKKTGPLAPSAGVIMARGTISEKALEFVYAVGDGSAAAPATVTFDLAKDFSGADTGGVLTTYDYAIRRVIVLDDKAHKFHNISLYALVASLAQVAGVDATFTPSKQALDPDQAARLAKLLRAFTPLSPAAVERIRASGYLPQTLAFGSGAQAQTWTLQSAVAVVAAYPMASSRKPPKPDMSDVQKAFGDASGIVIAAAAGQGPAKRASPSKAGMRDEAQARKLAATGHAAEALALFVSVLKADPYMPGVYKELGDLLRANGEPTLAWDLYDVERLIDNGAHSPATRAIDADEAALEKKYPELF
jgi:hypothetical protein